MNTLRGTIFLTMLSFLVLVAGICDSSAWAIAKPQVLRKKIKVPVAVRNANKTVHGAERSSISDMTTGNAFNAGLESADKKSASDVFRAKSDFAATPPTTKAPVAVARKTEAVKAQAGGFDLKKARSQKKSKAVPAAVAVPTPRPAEIEKPFATVSKNAPSVKDGEVKETVASISVKEDKPPAAVFKTKSGLPLPYNPLGRVDPFEPLFKDEPEVEPAAAAKKKRVPRTPLERIDLGQLKLVGVILASSGNRALVQEASGKGYIIKEGTYIGTNSGKVTEIKNDRVVVAEEIQDVVGKPIIRNKELVLPKPPGE
jgi:type IV pilus assembly protein PilP